MFDKWSDPLALLKAWKRVRANKGAAGGDGQTLEQFGIGLDARLTKLSRQLRNGRYSPGPLRRIDIVKPDGGARTLAIPCVRDRIAQAACAAAIDSRVDGLMSNASFAYRRGKSVEHAAGLVLVYRLRGYSWVVDGDIEKYFDSIPHKRLMETIGSHVSCIRTRELIGLWLHSFAGNGPGIAQGSPLSPLLANIYLTGLDRSVDRKDARLVRYADDFLIFTRSRSAAVRARERMACELETLGLRLHPDKTRIVAIRNGFDFVGLRFDGVTIRRVCNNK